MTDLTVLRVEVVGAGEVKEGSLESGRGKGSTGTSLAAGAVAGKVVSGGFKSELYNKFSNYNSEEREAGNKGLNSYDRGKTREARYLRRQFAKDRWNRRDVLLSRGHSIGQTAKMSSRVYAKNISTPTWKQTTTGVSAAAALGTQAFSMYSNYQKAGYEMSGATHAASVQARKSALASSGTQIAVAAMINPVAAAAMIAMKAYNLAQTNRKELFEIQKNQMMSQVLQRNLVKTVAERRF